MEYKYVLSKRALKEIDDSFSWYEKHSKQAADRFLIELEKTFLGICKNPTRGRNRYKNNLEVQLNEYPFSIIYKIMAEEIFIAAVFHHQRNPKRKYRKL
jgi:plasmid stabilization system protein ParE